MFIFFAALAAFQALLCVSAAPCSKPDRSPSYSTLPLPRLSPYYYFGEQAVSLADAYESGLRSVTLGFLTAKDKNNCEVAHDGTNASMIALQADAKNFVAKGGAINLSFGGEINSSTTAVVPVQNGCKSSEALAHLIRKQMKAYHTHNIEFDIEGEEWLVDLDSAQRLGDALAIIKQNHSDVFISYTMSAGPEGLSNDSQKYLQQAQHPNVTLDILNLMTMDFNDKTNPDKNMVKDSETAVSKGATQYATVYGGSQDQAMPHIGLLPMIGIDDNNEMISVADAATLGSYAKEKGLAMVSYWNLNRDFPSSNSSNHSTSGAPDQTGPYDFLTAFNDALVGC